MTRRIAIVLLCLAASTLGAQEERFVAPSHNTIVGSSEVSAGSDPLTLFYVDNRSTVPVVVFGFTLSSCENVKQWCGGQRVNIPIEPGRRRLVGRVQAKSPDVAMSYRWSFSWRADSSDAKVVELLRRNGFGAPEPPTDVVRMGRPVPVDTSSPPGIEQPLSREPLTDAERRGMAVRLADSTEVPKPFRFKVFYGSVLGSSMMPGAPIQRTGPCINPAEYATYEKNARITRTPWRPAVVSPSLSRTPLPPVLRDSTLAGDALVRWVTDTTGAAVPGSVNVLESPSGRVSMQICHAVIPSRAMPARDRTGRAVLAWTQMPVRIER